MFGFFENKEKLNSAMQVIESDRRMKDKFELTEHKRKSGRIIATLIALVVVGAFIFVILPKLQDKDGLDRRHQNTATQE